MRILITVESYYPLKNGVQEITQSYAEELSKTNDVFVFTRYIDGLQTKEKYNNVTIERFKIYTKKSLHFGDIKKYKAYVIEKAKTCDVVINVCTQNVFTDCLLNVLDLK